MTDKIERGDRVLLKEQNQEAEVIAVENDGLLKVKYNGVMTSVRADAVEKLDEHDN